MKAGTSESAAGGRGHLSRGVSTPSATAGLPGGAGSDADTPAAFALDACRHHLKRRLASPLRGLFHELTGLRLHAWWSPPAARVRPGELLRLCPRAHERPAGKLPARCEACLRKQWQRACEHQKMHKRFTGRCGSLNYCACLNIQGLRLLSLVVQQPPPLSRAGWRAFIRAISLARLLVHDLEATLKAERSESAGPRAGLPPGSGCLPEARLRPAGKHSRQRVEVMLGYIQEHYSDPLQLSDLAAAVGLNASYVSDLFSTTLGVTFHHYLEELRVAKAKELLRDPRKQVCEVARAVGYTSPNHFRSVFSARVGRPPSAWRYAASAR